MTQLIKPLSAVDLATTAANFPALKHAFTLAGLGDSDTTLTDSVSGVVLTSSGTFSRIGTDAFNNYLNIIDTVTGTFAAAGTSDFMLVSIGNMTTSQGVTLGDTAGTTGPGLIAKPGASNRVGLDESNYHVIGALSDTADLTGVAVTRSGNVTAKYGCDSSAILSAVAGSATLDISTAWPALASAADITSANETSTYLTGAFFFVFTGGLPGVSSINQGISWMSQNPGKVFPGWAGMA